MSSPKAVINERARMRRRGFKGRAGRIVFKARDGAHYLRVVEYNFGVRLVTKSLFVEVWESHDRARRARVAPLAELVHLLQNIGEDEFWQVCARAKPQR